MQQLYISICILHFLFRSKWFSDKAMNGKSTNLRNFIVDGIVNQIFITRFNVYDEIFLVIDNCELQNNNFDRGKISFHQDFYKEVNAIW